jgi:hypothetical protein
MHEEHYQKERISIKGTRGNMSVKLTEHMTPIMPRDRMMPDMLKGSSVGSLACSKKYIV